MVDSMRDNRRAPTDDLQDRDHLRYARAAEAGGGASLADVDHIHGGDIGRPEIIDALRRIAPECDRSFTNSAPCEPVGRWVSLKRRKGPMGRRRKDCSDPLSR